MQDSTGITVELFTIKWALLRFKLKRVTFILGGQKKNVTT